MSDLAKKINFSVLPSMFNGGSAWAMRVTGWGVIALVNEDGTWVMPPIKCKSYIDDAIAGALTGKDDYGACGYHLPIEYLYKKNLSLVWGFVPGVFEFGLHTLRLGEAWFHKLTGHMFSAFKYTVLDGKMQWWWKDDKNELIQFSSVLIEYDGRINWSHLMHSLMIVCFRAGWVFETSGAAPTLGQDPPQVNKLRVEGGLMEMVQCKTDLDTLLTVNVQRRNGLKVLLENYPKSFEEGVDYLKKVHPNSIHGRGFRDAVQFFADHKGVKNAA